MELVRQFIQNACDDVMGPLKGLGYKRGSGLDTSYVLAETFCVIRQLAALGGCRQSRTLCSAHPPEERAVIAFSVHNKYRATAKG